MRTCNEKKCRTKQTLTKDTLLWQLFLIHFRQFFSCVQFMSTFLISAQQIPLFHTQEFPLSVCTDMSSLEWEQSVRFLETKGFSVGVQTKNFPDGVYIAEGFSQEGKVKGWNLESEIPEQIIVKNIGWPVLSECPQKPDTKMGLKVVPHASMVIVMGSKEHGWESEFHSIPFSRLSCSIADTTGIQYGQSAFEGACAMKNKDEQVFGFRFDKNSERMSKSTTALNLPFLDSQLVQNAIEHVVQSNTAYIPKYGEGQLYIRPSGCGLSGGLGIVVPDRFVFTVEVAAMGAYFNPTISIEGLKNVHRAFTGKDKISPNYGASFVIKKGVKERGYTDYLSFTPDGFVEEVATCAVGFIDKNDAFVFPPVQDEIDNKERHILPSITRYSVIDILRDSGETVCIKDVHSTDIEEMIGMFTMGNAVGLLHVDRLCVKEDEKDTGQLIKFPTKSKDIIFKLKEKLISARLGELEGFTEWGKLLNDR